MYGDYLRPQDFGAKGDGSTDDTVAMNKMTRQLQDAGRGGIFCPPGIYQLSGPVDMSLPNLDFAFVGAPGAKLRGNFAGALWERRQNANGPIGGVHVLENMKFENGHPQGKCVAFHSSVGARIINCQISADGVRQSSVGIENYGSQSISIENCVVMGCGIGISAGNATNVIGTDVTGCVDGIRHQNLGLVVLGGRYEVNKRAIALGVKEDGSIFQSTGFDIAGLSMESNGIGIHVAAGAGGSIRSSAITNNTAGNRAGIYWDNAEEVSVQSVCISSGQSFSDGAFFMGNPQRCSVKDTRINVPQGSRGWVLPTNGTLCSVEFTNVTPKVDAACQWDDLINYGAQLPLGTVRRIANASTGTPGARIAGSGDKNVTAIKTGGRAWIALGPGA